VFLSNIIQKLRNYPRGNNHAARHEMVDAEDARSSIISAHSVRTRGTKLTLVLVQKKEGPRCGRGGRVEDIGGGEREKERRAKHTRVATAGGWKGCEGRGGPGTACRAERTPIFVKKDKKKSPAMRMIFRVPFSEMTNICEDVRDEFHPPRNKQKAKR
jgi:hypothetical protein